MMMLRGATMSREFRTGAPISSPIVFSTEARGLSGRTAKTPREQAVEAEIKSVALAQPHRRGDDSPQSGSALGRLCKRQKWAEFCFQAGLLYADDVHRFKAGMGLPIWRVQRSPWAAPEDSGNAEFYRVKLEAADAKLREIKIRLPGLMVDLCYLDNEPNWSSVGFIGDALALLSLHYGLRKPTKYDR